MVMGDLPAAPDSDVLVIGGGPGGYAAAFRAADLGLQVTLVNAEPKLGGVCLLRGCIPSKTLLYLTGLMQATREAGEMGIEFGKPKVKLKKLRGWKEQVVDTLSDGLAALCSQRGIERVQGRARFTGRDKICVEDSGTKSISFKHAIIATGSRPVPLPGTTFSKGGRIMSSAGALALANIPETLLVVGGGYVGMELGMVYAALGSKVTLAEAEDRLLYGTDPDLVEPLARRVKSEFEAVHLSTSVAELKETENAVEVKFKGGKGSSASFERVLVAVGRKPNTEDLGLNATAVERDDDGRIVVDRECRSGDERIFAIGDVTGGMMLAHKAMAEGKVAAEVIAGEPMAFDARAIPAVVYTDPQIAWCGLTESEANRQARKIKVTTFPWRAAGRALSMGATSGLTKIVSDADNGRVLGVGMVGREAEALIAEGVLAIEMGAVVRDLGQIVHPHPTLSETLGEAAEAFFGQATHIVSGR